MNLGDLLPDDQLSSLRSSTSFSELKKGMVIRKFDSEANKGKWMIIIGFDDAKILLAGVRINSEINLKVFNTKEKLDLQYPLSKSDNSFLKWDSYVDCLKLVERNISDLISHININPNEFLGCVTNRDLELITGAVCESPAIPPKKLKQFGLINS